MYSFEYNGYTLENNDNVSIDIVEGLSRVPLRISEDTLTGGDGGNIWAEKFDMRQITIEGEIYADDLPTYYALRATISNAFTRDAGLQELVVTRSDGVQRSIFVKVVEVPEFRETAGEFAQARFQIVLKAPDPFWVDSESQTYTAVLPIGGGGPVANPVPGPIGIGEGNLITFSNDGDVEAYAEILIDGQVVTPVVNSLTKGQSFRMNETINLGEQVRLTQTTLGFNVTKDSVNDFENFAGTFFKIAVGTNAIRFTASASSPTALLTIIFRNRYLSI